VHPHHPAHPPGFVPREPSHCPQCGGPLEERVIKQGDRPRLVCGRCHEVCWLDPKLAAGTLVVWQGGLLLVKRSIEPGHGRWVFPGGFVDRYETVEGAARREALEEAGVTLGELRLIGLYSYADSAVVLITFEASIVSGEPAPGDECSDVRSYPLDAIPWEDLAFRSTRDAVRDWVERARLRA
jgi:ADP-ribose pyrophosphatase YjhB (NUDIX family)